MTMEGAADIERLAARVTAAFPELAGAPVALLAEGWDCLALEVDGRLIFKFPRRPDGAAALRREAALLELARPAVARARPGLALPDLTLCPGPPLFSRHDKIPGEHLLAPHYADLPPPARRRLAEDLAGFLAALHGLDPAAAARAGAGPVAPWQAAQAIRRRALPLLPAGLRGLAEAAVGDWQRLPPDPLGTTFGFFDGHGWNMAFDHAEGRLNGLYDFGDAGFGPLHQEFVYPGFVDLDLTARVLDAYEALTGRSLDRPRIALLTGILRLSELAELADDPQWVPWLLRSFADWAASRTRLDGEA